MKGVYLASYRDRHYGFDIDYNDVDSKTKPDLLCDMLDVDLTKYDYVLASPPCNFWSRANYRRYESPYSQMTKHLLPSILIKLSKLDIPWIVENVQNRRLMTECGVFDINPAWQCTFMDRHTYWSNCPIPWVYSNSPKRCQFIASSKRQGIEVHAVFESWLNLNIKPLEK